MRRFLYIFLVLGVGFLSSCSNSSNTVSTSAVAQLNTFRFLANSRYPGLAAAKFTIEERVDTGLVYNADSLLFGTRLDTVVPKFTFVTTPGSARLTLSRPDTTFYLTGNDTVDFTRQPIYLTINSSDGSTTKVYEIRVTVHQTDPDLFVWHCLNEGIYPLDDSEQRVLRMNDMFVMIANNGFENHVYTSSDGAVWEDQGLPVGLPSNCHVRSIVADDSLFHAMYYAADGVLYTSSDALQWTAYPCEDPRVQTMLMHFNEQLWAVALEDEQLVLASIADDGVSLNPMTAVLPDNFPVNNFAAAEFANKSNRPRAIVLGGYAMNGDHLNSRWSFEYSAAADEYRVQNLTIEQPQFTSLTGAEIVWYDNRLYMFGGVNKNMHLQEEPILISDDEGLNWVAPDSGKNELPVFYGARQRQSAVVLDNNIYLIGGQNEWGTHSDVYKGRLNSIDWIKRD